MNCPICDDKMEKCDFCKKMTYCLNCGCQSPICNEIKMKRIRNRKSETITFRLSKGLLQQIDSYAKYHECFNRTQAIEELITEGLNNVIY